jgi:hypothetical protein
MRKTPAAGPRFLATLDLKSDRTGANGNQRAIAASVGAEARGVAVRLQDQPGKGMRGIKELIASGGDFSARQTGSAVEAVLRVIDTKPAWRKRFLQRVADRLPAALYR